MLFVLTMTPASSFLQIIRPAEAAALTHLLVLPTSNIVNERATYDILLRTATTGTIKTIQIDFPLGFDLAVATRLIERSGIGSGSLSVINNPDVAGAKSLRYTVSSAVSIPAGTDIRLEIARIIATAPVFLLLISGH